MSTPPPPPPTPPNSLNYATPAPLANKNRWWMILLRIIAGIFAATASAALGAFFANVGNNPFYFYLPPGLVFATLVVLTVKYRRFGYLSGFILAPFLAFIIMIVLLAIVCGTMRHV